MPSLDASVSLLLTGLALAIYIVLRRRPPTGSAVERVSRPALRLGAENNRHTSDRPDQLLQWQVEMHDTARQLKAELDSKLAALQALVLMARRESDRLEDAIRRAASVEVSIPTDSLALLEGLGDPVALENSLALTKAAENLTGTQTTAFADPFAGEQADLALANLSAKGFSASQIAERLRLPLGEVEFRLNLLAR